MKLYIRFGSLAKFQRIFDSNEYLQVILTPTRSNVYFIETDDLSEARSLSNSGNKISKKGTPEILDIIYTVMGGGSVIVLDLLKKTTYAIIN